MNWWENHWEKHNACPKCKQRTTRFRGQVNEWAIFECYGCGYKFEVNLNSGAIRGVEK